MPQRCGPALQHRTVAVQQVRCQAAVQQVAGSLQLAVTRSSAGGGTTFRSCTCCAGQVESDEEVRLCAAAVGDHRQAHPLQGNGLWQQVLQLGHMGRLQDTGAGRSVFV